jgi:hypothetical protein
VLHSMHHEWCSAIRLHHGFLEECMTPAIDAPVGVSTDPYNNTVCCLRGEQK